MDCNLFLTKMNKCRNHPTMDTSAASNVELFALYANIHTVHS